MTDSLQAIVKCQDPGDGSGDVIIDLPSEILAAMNISLGDLLTVEMVNGSILLKPIRDADRKP
ncbi:AbrB/MazE/SpoVT family DNA-binding domain-containing protein [Pseudomonas asiatica]|uniref:AbrB/MazE/SpoVT family DNA-binding domain-containing protein n=1 Tax=Pseudomonas asiatica TaxID=2219225 RepID=UPI002E7AD102|nr:AbrB/MazE/SpoVT family DNA-binding domain-containing protein [Pseudomonas asiatica]MEE1916497.1 AbrB/MazE/SpoVT family DNA-binding domain-containing protein [Pseudomonas asiatica]